MTAEDEAKQLDSVTDRIQEKELDESRATQALGALSTTKSSMLTNDHNGVATSLTTGNSSLGSMIQLKKEDVDIIMDELEVTEDEAMAALRLELREDANLEGEKLVEAALRRLVTS